MGLINYQAVELSLLPHHGETLGELLADERFGGGVKETSSRMAGREVFSDLRMEKAGWSASDEISPRKLERTAIFSGYVDSDVIMQTEIPSARS